MNINIKKNISYSLSANMINMMISTLNILLLPKFIEPISFGVWQLYIFYLSYVGILCIGIVDGIFLKYGGYNFSNLNKSKMTTQLVYFAIIQVVFSIITIISCHYTNIDNVKHDIIVLASITFLPLNMFYMMSYIFQMVNNIKNYAIIIVTDRFIFFINMLIYILGHFNNIYLLIILDLINKFITFFLGIYLIRRIFCLKLEPFNIGIKELKSNISIGSKLSFSIIANMMILGIIRLAVSEHWSIEVFGNIALILSISNFLVTFINAISVVLFPIIKRIEKELFDQLYSKIRVILLYILLGTLIIYYPLNMVLTWWLPKYIVALKFLSILFPICVFESKLVLLSNTYLKAMRKEKYIFINNIFVLLLSIIFTFICVYVLDNIFFSLLMILFIFIIRSTTAEFIIEKFLKISLKRYMVSEFCLVFIFVFFNNYYYDNLIISFVIYIIAYSAYCFWGKRNLSLAIKFLKSL